MATVISIKDVIGGVVPKSGSAVLAVTSGLFHSHETVSARVYQRSSENPDDLVATYHGLGLAPWYYSYVCADVEAMLIDDQASPSGIEVGGKMLRFQRQVFCGKDLITVRLYHQNAALGPRPSKSGLSLQPKLWTLLLPNLRQALDELSY